MECVTLEQTPVIVFIGYGFGALIWMAFAFIFINFLAYLREITK